MTSTEAAEEKTIVERLREKAAERRDEGWEVVDWLIPKEVEETADIIEHLQARVKELEAELGEAIEGWADGANYKGEYLKAKHGDEEGIAKARSVLLSEGK